MILRLPAVKIRNDRSVRIVTNLYIKKNIPFFFFQIYREPSFSVFNFMCVSKIKVIFHLLRKDNTVSSISFHNFAHEG